MKQQAISLDTAVELATVSRRTLWRRVQEGKVGRAGLDVRGRALLVLDDLRALLAIRLEDEADARLLVDADQGSSEAQNELGILCLEQSQPLLAVYWFNQAAEQGHADAMYHLSRLYLHGFDQLGGLAWRKTPARPLFGCLKRRCRGMQLLVSSWRLGWIVDWRVNHGVARWAFSRPVAGCR